MKDLPKPIDEYEVAFTTKEIIKALMQQAVNENRLPSSVLLQCTIEFIKDERGINHAVLKANTVKK